MLQVRRRSDFTANRSWLERSLMSRVDKKVATSAEVHPVAAITLLAQQKTLIWHKNGYIKMNIYMNVIHVSDPGVMRKGTVTAYGLR